MKQNLAGENLKINNNNNKMNNKNKNKNKKTNKNKKKDTYDSNRHNNLYQSSIDPASNRKTNALKQHRIKLIQEPFSDQPELLRR